MSSAPGRGSFGKTRRVRSASQPTGGNSSAGWLFTTRAATRSRGCRDVRQRTLAAAHPDAGQLRVSAGTFTFHSFAFARRVVRAGTIAMFGVAHEALPHREPNRSSAGSFWSRFMPASSACLGAKIYRTRSR